MQKLQVEGKKIQKPTFQELHPLHQTTERVT